MATQPMSYEGPQSGEEPKDQHNPCLRGVPRVGRNQNGYITPAFLGVLVGGNQNCYAIPAFVGSKKAT